MSAYPYFSASLPSLEFVPESPLEGGFSVERICQEALEVLSPVDAYALAYLFAPSYHAVFLDKMGNTSSVLAFEPLCLEDKIASLPYLQKASRLVKEKGSEYKLWRDFYQEVCAENFWKKMGFSSAVFMKQYFRFDQTWRMVHAFLEQKKYPHLKSKEIYFCENWAIEMMERMSVYDQGEDLGLSPIWEYAGPFFEIAAEGDVLQREIKTDRLRWQYAQQCGGDNTSSTDYLWSYFVRLQIQSRWDRLHRKDGAGLLRKKMDELKNIDWSRADARTLEKALKHE